MKDWLRLIGMVITGVLMLIMVVVFSGAFLMLLGLFLAFFVVIWAVGARITVSHEGRKIGYIRWMTFYRYDRPVDDPLE